MRKAIISVIILLLSIADFVGAQPPAKVVVDEVFEKEIKKTNRIIGIVDFDIRSGISPEISGLIEKLHFEEGQIVKKGALLVEMNTDFILKNIEIARAEKSQIDIQIQNTDKNLKRYESLFKAEATTEKAYDDLLDQSRELSKKREALTFNIEKLELELRKCAIRAPFNGIILERHKTTGEWVDPGAAVCTLASTEALYVRVSVPEEMVPFIKPGDKINVVINALNKEMTGVIEAYLPVADLATKTFQIKIALPYFEDAIQNMSTTVHVPASHKVKLRMIKRAALIRNQGKEFVYTIENQKAKILPVNIVGYEGDYVGVDNPYITVGMSVIVDGNDRLRPDQAVEVIQRAKP